MFEVKVLYATPTADPKIWVQPFNIETVTTLAALRALPKTGVLAVSIFLTGPPRKLVSRLYSKMQRFYPGDPTDVIYGTDYFGFARYRTAAKNLLFWDQWDEDEDKFFAIDLDDLDAGVQTFTRPSPRLPAVATVIKVFAGAYVHPPDWEAARLIIDSDLRV